MKKILFTIILFFTVFHFSFSQDHSRNFTIDENGNYVISVSVNNYELINTVIDGVNYHKIKFSSSVSTNDAGWAELPVLSAAVQLPNDKNFEIISVNPVYEEVSLNYPLLPSRGVIYRNQDPSTIPYHIAPESLVDAYYPLDLVSVESPFIIKNVRGTSIKVYPFQYNPITNKLRVCRNVVITGQCNSNSPVINPLVNASSNLCNEEIGMYRSIFINYTESKQALATGEYGDILVIYTSRDASTIQPYIQWKREKGYVVYEEQVTTGTNVQTIIQDYYGEHPNLFYVQLVGDWADIKSPTISLSGDSSPNPDPTDPYMGCVSGSDNFPDIAIGRFSCSNATELQTQINKAINYEKTPNMDASWRESFIGIASNEGSGSGDDGEIDYTHIQRLYTQRLQNFTYNTHYQNYAPSASATTLAGHINSGASTIAYCGHGADKYFVTTEFSNNNISNLTNGDKLPFIVSVACVNGSFHGTSDCFAEAWLKKQNGGAVVTAMSTINQPWTPPQRIQDYFYDILTGGFDYSQYSGQNGLTSNEQRTFWGSILVNAFNLGLTESNASEDLETTKTWTTFGDASLQLRTKQPETITSSQTSIMAGIDFSTTITIGTTPVENAMVCISQNGNYFSGITNASGQVSIQHTLSAGQALLVVTAFNTTTIYETIDIITPNPPTADFTGAPTTILEGESVSFTNNSLYAATNSWTFGDGQTSTAVNPVITYTTAGTYTVSLTVTNTLGSDTKTRVDYITVNPNTNPPTADFISSATNIIVGSTIDFTDLSINNPTSWSWTFDGGTPASSSQQNPSGITYSTVGTYAVTLIASNQYGSNTETKYINVTPPDYCDAGSNDEDEYIGTVSFNTINNVSAGYSTGGYGDFTSISTTVVKGNTYPISINVPTNYSQDRVYVWIDYNIDGTFDNLASTELAFTQNTTGQSSGATVNKTYSGNITIPTTATTGTTRMRIRLQYNGTYYYTTNDTPCGNSSYGEVEDYNIIIASETGHNITATTSGNGTISPSGISNVEEGNNITYTITPNACSEITNVTVDGTNMGAITSYTFTNVTANHTISATFANIVYNVTVNNSVGGEIVANNTINCNSNLTVTFVPDDCYELQSVLINNNPVQFSGNVYIAQNVNSDITIDAVFAEANYNIVSSTDGNGTITPLGTTIVACGNDQTYEIVPNEGFYISALYVNSTSISPVQSYTFQNVNSDNTIEVEFSLITDIEGNNISDIIIYPNPSNGIITIKGDDIQNVDIYDAMGRIVLSEKHFSNSINLSNLSDGLYNVRIYSNDKFVNKQVIIKR